MTDEVRRGRLARLAEELWADPHFQEQDRETQERLDHGDIGQPITGEELRRRYQR